MASVLTTTIYPTYNYSFYVHHVPEMSMCLLMQSTSASYTISKYIYMLQYEFGHSQRNCYLRILVLAFFCNNTSRTTSRDMVRFALSTHVYM